MIRNSNLLHRTSVFLTPVLLLLLASCGSYQYSGNSDGIYGESSRTVDRPRTGYDRPQNANEQREEKLNEANSYYKNMFAQQSAALENAMQENVVFTDIDSYSSNSEYSEEEEMYNEEGTMAYNGSYAPWGQGEADDVTVNIYNNGGYWGPWRRGLYNPYYAYGYGFGWNAFYDPYFYGQPYWSITSTWGHPYYGAGWGFGWGGFHNPWRYGYGYNSGWLGRYHGGYYANNYYHHPQYSYSNSRRSSRSNYNAVSRRENTTARSRSNSSYSRRIRDIRNTDSNSRSRSSVSSRVADRENSNVYSRSTRRTSSASYSRSNSSSSRSTIGRSSSNSNSSYQSSRSSMPTRSSVRTSTPTRSSGSVGRSSSSSSRSSGSSSRGGSSRGGRGGRG